MNKPKAFMETDRAHLRAFCEEDYTELVSMMSDLEVMKYTGFRSPQSPDQVMESLRNWIREGKGPFGVWCAEDKLNGEFIGWFMLKKHRYDYPELGFMLPRKRWGQGLACEISHRILKYALEDLGVEKVLATTVKENVSSISVLKKIGMCISNVVPIRDPNFEIICFEKCSSLLEA